MSSKVASIYVAGLECTSRYVDHFLVEIYADSGLTTLVGSKTSTTQWDGVSVNYQKDFITFDGLTYGSTYYLRSTPVAPISGAVNWSSTLAVVAGSSGAPALVTYTGTYTSTFSGINLYVLPANVPSDIDHYEAIWTWDGSVPPNTAQAISSALVTDGSGHFHLFVGGVPTNTTHVYVRAVNTAGLKQSWTSLGTFSVATTTGVINGSTGANVNLIPDSDFKFNPYTTSSTAASYWEASPPPFPQAWIRVPGAGYNSSTALALTDPTAGAIICNPFTVQASTEYTLSAYIDASQITAGSAEVICASADLSTVYGTLTVSAGQANRISTTFTLPSGAAQAVIEMTPGSGTTIPSGKKLLFSVPMLQAGPGMTAYIPGSFDTAGTIAHGAMSTPVQNAIAKTGIINYDALASQVQNAIDVSGTVVYGKIDPIIRGAIGATGIVNYSALNSAITNAIDASGNVQNLGGILAAYITPIHSLMPAQAGADVTSLHTAADTTNVNGVASHLISPISGLMPAQAGADVTSDQAIAYSGAGESIVPNGDFILGNAQGWYLSGAAYQYGGGPGVFSDAVVVTASVAGGNIASTPSFRVVPGQKYRIYVTGFVDASGGTSPDMRVQYSPGYPTPGGWGSTYTQFTVPFVYDSEATYSYDWTAPSGAFYACIQVYPTSTTGNLYIEGIDCIPYQGTGQWGADVTGSNTANDTTNVNGIASHLISPISGLMPAQAGADVTGSNTSLNTLNVGNQTAAIVSGSSTGVLLQNPNFAAGNVGWNMGPGWSIVTGTSYVPGSGYYAQLNAPSANNNWLNNNQSIPCSAGDIISASCWVGRASGANATAVACSIAFYTNSSSYIGLTQSSNAMPASSNWAQSRVVATAPSGTAFAQIVLVPTNATGQWDVCGFTAAIHPNSQDEVPDGLTYRRVSGVNASNQTTTSTYQANSISSSLVSIVTSNVTLSYGTTFVLLTNATLPTNGGVVKISASALLSQTGTTGPASVQINVMKGNNGGTSLYQGNIVVPINSGWTAGSSWSTAAILDTTPAASQLYSIYASIGTTGNATATQIVLSMENLKA